MSKYKSPLELLGLFIGSVIVALLELVRVLWKTLRYGPIKSLTWKARKYRPDILQGNEYGEHTFVRLQQTSIKLHCVVSGPVGKPLMLFIHGFPEFWYSWRHQIKKFNKEYRTVAVDLRGYGESDKPRCVSDYCVDKIVEDIAQLIPALGYKDCFLVTHDVGGVVGWNVVDRHPDMIKKFIVMNSPLLPAVEEFVKDSPFSMFTLLHHLLLTQVPVLPMIRFLSHDQEELEDVYCGDWVKTKPGTFTKEDLACFKYSFSSYDSLSPTLMYNKAFAIYQPPKLGRITIPCLMIWGANDPFLNKKTAELTGKYVDNYTLKFINTSSHWVQQEEPDIVNDYISEFIQQ